MVGRESVVWWITGLVAVTYRGIVFWEGSQISILLVCESKFYVLTFNENDKKVNGSYSRIDVTVQL